VNETSTSIEAVANKIRDCLREEGLDPELELGEGEGIVAARTKVGDDILRVAVHISTHEFVPSNAGAADAKETRKTLSDAIARPTLEPRSAAGPHDPHRGEVNDTEGADEETRTSD
jgi:hypothetical protein